MSFFSDVLPLCTERQRVNAFQRECQHLGLDNQTEESRLEAYSGLLCDDRHGLLYLGFAKAGSTSWLVTLMEAASAKPAHGVLHSAGNQAKYGLKRLSSKFYSKKEILHRIRNYFTFIVVRNPFDRLVSTWRNKFVQREGMFHGLSKKLTTMYPRNEYHNATGRWNSGFPNDVATFPQFVMHLRLTHQRNSHWKHYHSSNPCAVEWDAILKLETADVDTYPVINRLRKDHDITKIPEINSQQTEGQLHLGVKHLPEFTGVIPVDYKYLFDVYQRDFDLFGYSWDRDRMVASCVCEPEEGHSCC